ncbi:MAG: NADH:flavin oxidoreductase [Xanthomonadales bacterium]|nr:NADH:flavin oxidoreductase [Xanthomonadales bacterium]MDH4018904.1 NADH:flavin oxidoreductase [Xanthomonadales bacterium]
MGEKLFTRGKIAGLSLKNRVIRAGCFEGMCQGGQVTDALIDHHRRVARGGVAMTTVAYCSVSHDGRAFEHELWMRDEITVALKKMTDTIHAEGAAASIQLGHSGFFTSRSVIGKRPLGASAKWCTFTMSYCGEMTEADIGEKVQDFVNAAVLAKESGFDAVEIHSGHGYLLSQFLSPWTNKRKDGFGGNLENRMRFPVMVIEAVRRSLGRDYPILVKMNQTDGMPGGITLTDAVVIAKAYEKAGASALIPSAGFTSKVPFLMLRGNLPVKEMSNNQKKLVNRIGLKLFGRFMVPEHQYESMFLFEGAKKIREAVGIPVIYIGGVESKTDMTKALDSGFDFVQIGRATLQDPDFVKKIESGEITQTKCDHCNRCVAAMDAGGVYCVSNERGFLKV